jgi:endonuclease
MNNGQYSSASQVRHFHSERELNMLMRRKLNDVEPGLVAADNGRERAVATGKIDITALDIKGNYVVIELKLGPCPNGAIEQVLAYSSDLEQETGKPCRSIIVASEFSDRQRAAATRANDLYLVTYFTDNVPQMSARPN